MKIKELLTKENWIKGFESLDQDGGPMNPRSEYAFCWCIVGAINKCYQKDDKERNNVLYAIQAKIGHRGDAELGVSGWNDKEERTFEDVKKLVEELDI